MSQKGDPSPTRITVVNLDSLDDDVIGNHWLSQTQYQKKQPQPREDIFSEADVDKDESLTQEEFVRQFGSKALFDAYDENHDQSVTRKEFEQIRREQMENIDLTTWDGWKLFLLANGDHKPPPRTKFLVALLTIAIVDVIIASTIAMYLNYTACGNVWECDMTGKLTETEIGDNSMGDGYINFFYSPIKSCAFAAFLSMLSLGVKYKLHPSYSGIFHFVIFLIFFSVISLSIHGGNEWTASTTHSAGELGAQLRNILEDDWAPGQQWDEIITSGDYYNWMRNIVKGFLFAASDNMGCGKRMYDPSEFIAEPDLAPTICTNPGVGHVWHLVGCNIRQLRVKALPYQKKSKASSTWGNGTTEIYPAYADEYLETMPRNWTTSKGRKVSEGWIDDKMLNTFERERDSPPFYGSKLIGAKYTGQSGFVFGGDFDDNNTMGTRWSIDRPLPDQPGYSPDLMGPWKGWWNGYNSPSPDGSKFDQDVNDMQEGWWIDERTRLVQMTCRGLNANTDQSWIVIYSLEISSAGLVNPMPPSIGTEILFRDITDVYDGLNSLLVFAFYYMNEVAFLKPQNSPNNSILCDLNCCPHVSKPTFSGRKYSI